MEVVGEAVLSALLQPLFDKLTSGELRSFARKTQVYNEVKNWESRLLQIRAVLNDAEEKQTRDPAVKSWLSKLRDLAYDVDDILDDFVTEISRSKLKEEPRASTSTAWNLTPTCCVSLKPSVIVLNVKMHSKLRKITARLKEVVAEKDILDLGTLRAEGRSNRVNERLPTTSLVKEPKVYGREEDKQAILELMQCETSNPPFSVISIIGLGGIGKTTLAQDVFNDDRMRFDYKAWVCVSDTFNIISITQTILQVESREDVDLNSLQLKLKEKLSGKKFLIVLDDVWNEKYEDWTTLSAPFATGAPGSKIIVTTRSQDVASVMGSVSRYQLEGLSQDDCLSLFTQHALNAGNFDGHPGLKEIGQELVQRCKGLPLAVKTLAGLLRGKQNREEWKRVLNSRIWDLPEDKSGIFPALRLSYHHLPSHLKQCFAYCAIFPKDFEFDKNELVLLWMAEGFLQQSNENEEMEDVGRKYFDDLLSRSFFQRSSSSTSLFVMHDLICDLARSINGEICFNLEDASTSKDSYAKFHYSSFTRRQHDISPRFEVFYEMKGLRTLLALPMSTWYHCFLSSKVLDDLVPKLKRLRVLSLAGYRIKELPSSIGALKHLRYLNLSYTDIESLPESLCELFNLQTLRLRGCERLIKLPTCITSLTNLQYLDISGTNNLQEMPLLISDLKDLCCLNKFIVGAGDGLQIKELMAFSHLQGQLHILGLQNVANFQDAKFANLKEKQSLNELALEWIDYFGSPRNERDELQVLNLLQPHQNLEELSVKSYGGTTFPSWIGDPSFSSMVCLQLCNCRKIASLPSLGQLPSLRDLRIEGMDGLKEVGVEFYGNGSPSVRAFQSLETLYIRNMLEWEQWCSPTDLNEGPSGIFPELLKLRIRNCPKLVGKLPGCLPSLKELEIDQCPQLEELPEMLPSLHKLDVDECQEVVLRRLPILASLVTLKISKVAGLTSFHEGLIQALVALEDLSITGCPQMNYLWQDGTNLDKLTCLKHLAIYDCSQLVSLVEGEEGLLPCNLQFLSISHCENLDKLPNGLHSLASLEDLSIYRCRKLVSFPAATGLSYGFRNLKKLYVEDCPTLTSIFAGEFPDSLEDVTICYCTRQLLESLHPHDRLSHLTKLKLLNCSQLESFPESGLPILALTHLNISECERLRSLPNQMQNLISLQTLKIKGCRGVVSFPEGGLPPNLTRLHVSWCENLRSLPNQMQNLMSLQTLEIRGCRGVVSFPEGGLPPNLTRLHVSWCENLRSLPNQMQNLVLLQTLEIRYCRGVVSFPEGSLPPNLTYLDIWGCENLRFLPNQIQNLILLQVLDIKYCKSVVSFPERGLAPNLTHLYIWNCENLTQPISAWELHRLTSLKRLSITGISPSTNDDERLLLPTSLIYLRIEYLKNLKSISKGLQNLPSLQRLYIFDCPKIRYLPKKGLPPTLEELCICRCPLLKKRCLKKKGDYWPIIAHIPQITIDGDDQ